ncbi:hypothetical protein [Aromatoleum aromaticum]|uniref:p-cymene dehydrogenase subunit gamma n=1 Tax=Aromatoleum aromaticum TaxID=551760 RepID=A0A096ZNX1_9RHOO|nr:hypothetical protein [Aromatoleum aromaticum]AIS23701.1 p-cymene dehydrogenase subunit gamma [Aromatoleum aromaticum]NMG55177.1 hypothetical protein [Aromatoleum aromaticum]
MKVHRVARIKDYLSPTSGGWDAIAKEEVDLMPTPLAMQPTEYIRKSWEGRSYGAVKALRIASVHDGETWSLLASWAGVSPSGKDFPDAFAIALPVRGNPALALMGEPEAPIHYLRWAANKEGVQSILATGIGSSQPGSEVRCTVVAQPIGDVWNVVISRPLGSGKGVAPLQAGAKTRIGFAVWNGGNDERAGIKAFSIDWTELVLEA